MKFLGCGRRPSRSVLAARCGWCFADSRGPFWLRLCRALSFVPFHGPLLPPIAHVQRFPYMLAGSELESQSMKSDLGWRAHEPVLVQRHQRFHTTVSGLAVRRNVGLGSPTNSQPGRLRYVAQASGVRVLAASSRQFWWYLQDAPRSDRGSDLVFIFSSVPVFLAG